MPWMETISLGVLLLVAWFWFDSFQARAAGMAAARAACAAEDLLLLDDTVALGTLRPARDDEGRLRLQRVYRFEYSDTGDNRRDGQVMLLGSELLMVNLGQAQRSRLRLVASDHRDQHQQLPPGPL
ncbi:MAG: DUF3301 domain-containing protein [Candidatus Accumulibacter sp.]|uniref:DUF3301 domain-containing protein n=1 Tax=Candidatus Accumulibacter affinis TaxID=2954384 RepID=A0A935TD30_9PROT|nr:DUF3301 domain-containing protein [Candidatus Accumulibacter affinis]